MLKSDIFSGLWLRSLFDHYVMWGYAMCFSKTYTVGVVLCERGGTTHTRTMRGRGRVIFVSGVLLALLGAQSTLDSLKQHRIKIAILPWRHLDDWGQRGQAGKNKKMDKHRHTCTKGVAWLTEVSRIVIRWTVEAQVLQIRDEVRDCALVYALTLTEDVQLQEEHRYTGINICSNTLTVWMMYDQLTKQQDVVLTAALLVSWMKWITPACRALVWVVANGKLNVFSTISTQVTLSNISKSLALGWWMVQMIVRPPRAKDFMMETTWKQDALSKPLGWHTRRDRTPRRRHWFCIHVEISHIQNSQVISNLVGSSKNMTGGLLTSSRAMASLLHWPPEMQLVRVWAHSWRPRAVRISSTWDTKSYSVVTRWRT